MNHNKRQYNNVVDSVQQLEMSYSRKQMGFMISVSVSNTPLEHQCFMDMFNDKLQLFSCILLKPQVLFVFTSSCLWRSSLSVRVGHNTPRPFIYFLPADVAENEW